MKYCTLESKKMEDAKLFESDVWNERTREQKSFISDRALVQQECTQVSQDLHMHLKTTIEGKN